MGVHVGRVWPMVCATSQLEHLRAQPHENRDRRGARPVGVRLRQVRQLVQHDAEILRRGAAAEVIDLARGSASGAGFQQ